MAEMSSEHRRVFLAEGGRTGILATVRADGRPHAAPVWFTLDGDDLVFMTGADTVKARNLQRDPRATLVVDESTFPYAFVIAEGACELTGDQAVLDRWSTIIAAQYVPPDRAEEYGARNAVPGELVIRLSPDRFIAESGLAE